MSRSVVRGMANEGAYPPTEHIELTSKVDRFFSDNTVAKATRDLAYNRSERFRDATCSPKYYPKTMERPPRPTYWDAALKLKQAINQTQKEIAATGGFDGMIATSRAHEKLGLLIEHEEFRNDMRVIEDVQLNQPITDARGRIRLHAASVLELCEVRTTGEFDDK